MSHFLCLLLMLVREIYTGYKVIVKHHEHSIIVTISAQVHSLFHLLSSTPLQLSPNVASVPIKGWTEHWRKNSEHQVQIFPTSYKCIHF